jgi:2-amino-4-hydroxy-6-hydroxymethyldihydropteridine diphosphokinase
MEPNDIISSLRGGARPLNSPPGGWSLAILGLGSNLGDRNLALIEATRRVGQIPHCRLLRSSSLHLTEPLLVKDQREFFNVALLIETLLSPHELFAATQSIESAMGRLRLERYGPRTIDIDLLLFEGFVSSAAALAVPHYGIGSRRFCIDELAEFGIFVPAAGEEVLGQMCVPIASGREFEERTKMKFGGR